MSVPGESRLIMTDAVSPSELSSLRSRIEDVLDEHVRPGLHADGGDVEVVGIDADRIVQVRMVGACQGCPSAIMTLTFGIESTLKAQIPEIRFLEAVP
jgi:Fe-S cluster biogenesis protein NfuA